MRASTCPVDGWLGVSAGARTADEPGPAGEAGACRVPATTGTPGSSAQVDRWPVYSRLAAASPGDARPGLLGSTLASAGVPVAAVGPGAAIALADATGSVPHAWPGVPAAADGGIDTTAHSPDAAGAALATQVRQALATSPGLLAVDVGAVRERVAAARPRRSRPPTPGSAPCSRRCRPTRP